MPDTHANVEDLAADFGYKPAMSKVEHGVRRTRLYREASRLWRSGFVRSVALLASGTGAAHAITMAFAPIITRLYGPEAFGVLGTFNALLAVAAPIAALAYPIAVVLPGRDIEALGLLRLSGYIALVVSGFTALGLWLGAEILLEGLSIEKLGAYIYLLPVAMLATAAVQMAQQWLIRKKAFGVLARTTVLHSVLMNGAKAIAGLVMPIGVVLIALTTAGQALYALLMLIGIRLRSQAKHNVPRMNCELSIKDLAKRYRDFPLYRAPQNLIYAASSQSLPVLLLAAFFDPVAAGFYTLAVAVMGIPSILVGKAVSDVFYPRVTEVAHLGKDVAEMIIKATLGLLAIGILPFGLVVLFGPWMFALVFGSDWAHAGEYARWLSLFYLFNFINKPSVAAVPVLGIQKGLLVCEIFSASGKVAGFAVAVWLFGSDILAVFIFSIIGVAADGTMILWVIGSARKRKGYEETSR